MMKIIQSIQQKFQSLILAGSRYPLTLLFLVVLTVYSAMLIETSNFDNEKTYMTLLVGTMLSVVAQQIYERFFSNLTERLLLMGGALLLTMLFYFLLPNETFSLELSIKVGVILFALFIAYIWIPTIKNPVPFHASFLSAFRAFFITLLFTLVLTAGSYFILGAMNVLLFDVDGKVYTHVFNVVASLFAPLFFLSFTPPFLGKKDADLSEKQKAARKQRIDEATTVSNMLNILLSYVVIPLSAVFTIILFVYLLLNIRGSFWTDNLLEPMLVSYAIETILVYLLACNLQTPAANWYRKNIPTILIPIVLLQTIASILKINELGVTHGRYYVILFGFFAVVAGLIFSFLPPQKNGWVAALLLICSAISIMPPIDAFTVSRNNQLHRLESTLKDNQMLVDGKIQPNSSISTQDKETIIKSVDYLQQMDELSTVAWLPDTLLTKDKFKDTFGFSYSGEHTGTAASQQVYLNNSEFLAIPVNGFDYVTSVYLSQDNGSKQQSEELHFSSDETTYILEMTPATSYYSFALYKETKENNQPLLEVDPTEAFDSLLASFSETSMTLDEATTKVYENEQARLQIIVHSINLSTDRVYLDLYLLIDIK